MELSEFKKYCRDLERFSACYVDELEFMTEEELNNYQDKIELDTGDYSNDDHFRAFITLKKKISELEAR